jgi:hypothetical protein
MATRPALMQDNASVNPGEMPGRFRVLTLLGTDVFAHQRDRLGSAPRVVGPDQRSQFISTVRRENRCRFYVRDRRPYPIVQLDRVGSLPMPSNTSQV